MFISIDGANGVGKTTISTLVYERLQQKYDKVFLTKEPTNSTIGQFIKDLENIDEYKGYPLAYMILADRYYHIKKIEEKLNDGYIVITDRYIASSLVYQVLDGIDIEEVLKLNLKFKKPDIYFFITMTEGKIKEILKNRQNLTRFEIENTSFKELKLFDNAKTILEKYNYTCVTIYNNILEDSVEQILNYLDKIYNKT
jgi:dTMP kinase